MSTVVLESTILAVFLAFIRISSFLMLAPVFNFIKLPILIRLLLSMVLALFLTESFELQYFNTTIVSLTLAIINEIINGAAMAFGMIIAFAVFHFAGRIIDFQMGFGVAGLIDPATKIQAPLIGTLLTLLSSVIFILAGGISIVVRALAFSLRAVPPGQVVSLQSADWFIVHCGLIFTLSAALIAPVMLTVFLLDLLMAFAGRTMPQMNVFIISIPIKIVLGLIVLATMLTAMQPVFRRTFNLIFQFWEPFF